MPPLLGDPRNRGVNHVRFGRRGSRRLFLQISCPDWLEAFLGRVQLGLDPGFNNIQWTCQNAGHATCCSTSENLQAKSDISMSHPLLCQSLFLLVDGELNGGEWQISKDGGLVAVEKRGDAFFVNNGPGSMKGGSIVVT